MAKFQPSNTFKKAREGGNPFALSSRAAACTWGGAFFASEESFPEQNRFLAVSAPGNPQDFNGNRWGRRRRTPWILRFAKGKIAAAQIGSLRRGARRGRCFPSASLSKISS